MISEYALKQKSVAKCGLVAGLGFGTIAALCVLWAEPAREPVTSVKDAVFAELARIKPLEDHVARLRILCNEPFSEERNKEIATVMQHARQTVRTTHAFTSERFPHWTTFLQA